MATADTSTYLNPDAVRATFKVNAENYALQVLTQEAEIAGLESITDLDEPGEQELTARRREVKVASAKRDAFAERLAALPVDPEA